MLPSVVFLTKGSRCQPLKIHHRGTETQRTKLNSHHEDTKTLRTFCLRASAFAKASAFAGATVDRLADRSRAKFLFAASCFRASRLPKSYGLSAEGFGPQAGAQLVVNFQRPASGIFC